MIQISSFVGMRLHVYARDDRFPLLVSKTVISYNIHDSSPC